MITEVRVFTLMALCALAVGGCAHGQKDEGLTGGHSTNASASSASPSVGPGNTPKLGTGPAAAELSKFWFDSPYEPKGKRTWTKVDAGKWDETAADGTVSHYVGEDHFDMGGYHGIVVRGGPDDLNILIPDGGKGQLVRFREAAGGRNWGNLGVIEGVE